MEEWEKHIRRTHADKVNESWCGERLYSHEWAFVDVDHALHSIEQGTRILPCPTCLSRIQRLVSSVLSEDASSSGSASS